MNKIAKTALAAALALTLTACSPQENLIGEIKIPIYQPEQQLFNTTTVQRMDLSSTQSVGASIGYAFSDALSTARDGNLLSINVTQYQELKEGDVIAVIDSSALNYTLLEQEILTQAAYEQYLATGSQADRLTYEYENARLAAIQYEIDSYTITAPYDCIVTDVERMIDIGAEIPQGTYICSVAYPDDVYVYLSVDPKSETPSPFQLGTKVSVTLTGSSYEGTVVSYPVSTSYTGESYVMQGMNWGGGNMDWDGNNGSLTGKPTVDTGRYAIIGFEPEVLSAMLEETPGAVTAGWATVVVTTVRMSDVLCVPTSAVSRDGSYVYLYEDGQKLQIPVQTGGAINGYTVILGGIKEGDVVVL